MELEGTSDSQPNPHSLSALHPTGRGVTPVWVCSGRVSTP